MSFLGLFGEGGSIDPAVANLIVGEGVSLRGVAGTGASSRLKVYGVPFITGEDLLSVEAMFPNGDLVLRRFKEEVQIFDFSFSNPLPPSPFLLSLGDVREYTVTQENVVLGKKYKLTLWVRFRSRVIERTRCVNGNWGE